MPQGDKSSYTDKQKRQAEHIEAGYEKKGVSTKSAEARAWATVNKLSGGGKKERIRPEEKLTSIFCGLIRDQLDGVVSAQGFGIGAGFVRFVH